MNMAGLTREEENKINALLKEQHVDFNLMQDYNSDIMNKVKNIKQTTPNLLFSLLNNKFGFKKFNVFYNKGFVAYVFALFMGCFAGLNYADDSFNKETELNNILDIYSYSQDDFINIENYQE
jgi:hypothetical protein